MRLIDANNVISVLKILSDKCYDDNVFEQMISVLESVPTVDAVEVVHCRDCKYFGEYCDEYKEETQNDGMCELDIKDSVTFDWFCAYGERRDPCSSQDS